MEHQTTPVPAITPVTGGHRKFLDLKNKWTLTALIGAVVIVVAVVVLMWVKLPAFGKLGVDVAHTEGTVEYRTGPNAEWQAVPADLSLGEGAEVRTQEGARAILNIDDGSAVRLNANSSVVLKQLAPTHIVVQNTGGEVYTRVVKSDTRKFEVLTDEATYRSEGTGYRTYNTEKREGVEVYHSKVTILGLNIEGDVVVEQGERYYVVDRDNPDAAGKVTELTAEEIATDSFMQWNSEEDKKEFSDELGLLFDLTPPALEVTSPAAGLVTDADAVAVKGTTEPGAKVLLNGADVANNNGAFESTFALNAGENSLKVEAIDGAGNKTVKTIGVTRNAPAAPAPAPAPKAGITLYGTTVDKGISFSWNVSGLSTSKGFKLVASKNANPTYPGSSATFYDKTATSGSITSTSGTYYVRICMYHSSGCVNYSNEITVTIP